MHIDCAYDVSVADKATDLASPVPPFGLMTMAAYGTPAGRTSFVPGEAHDEETNYAPNFAYGEPGDPECDATGFSIHGQTVSPSNLCTTPNYTPASIGNIALLSGDDLDFNNSTVVYGDVIADNLIHASNALTIHGYINSENAKKSGNLNTFSNSVTVDVEKLPASFTASVPSHYSATQPAGGVTEHSVEVTGVRWAP